MFDVQHRWSVSLKPLFTGFILSVGLTIAAFFLVEFSLLGAKALLFAIFGLATLQAAVQLLCFLQLGIEAKPRWNLHLFLFGLLLMILVVVGSIWIMANLDYRMMPDMQMP